MNQGLIPLSCDEMTAEQAYQRRPEYNEVDFEKFKRNFESLQKSLSEEKARAARDSEGLARDKQKAAAMQGVPTAAQPGAAACLLAHETTAWEGSDAQKQLHIDMQRNRHLEMAPKQLWESHTDYNEHFPLETFRNHIYKEAMRQKRIAKAQHESKQCEDA
jgi:hypothetical protein